MRGGPIGALKRLAGRRGRLAVAACGLALVAVVAVIASGGRGRGDRGAPPPRTGRAQPAGRAARTPGFTLPALPARLASLEGRLPLARRVAQLFLVDFAGRRPPAALRTALRTHGWGGVLLTQANFGDARQETALARELAGLTRRSRPLAALLAADQPGGSATAFPFLPPGPQPRVAAAGRPARAEAEARAAGVALRRLGVTMTLAPQGDVDVPAGAVSEETFSSDPGTAARFTAAAVRGYRRAGVLPAVGHFPGEGAASQDPDLRAGSVGLSLADLRRRDELPFAAAVAAGAPVVVMSNASYAAWDGVTPAGLLPAAVAELRGRLGFRGVVLSGDLTASVLATGTDPGTAAVQALRAGADLLYVSGGPPVQERAYRAVLAAARNGSLPSGRLSDALTRVLALKLSAGVLPAR